MHVEPVSLRLRSDEASRPAVDGRRWLGPVEPTDEEVLERVLPPVLDIGCGPGRHVVALARRGVTVLGVDLTPATVTLARRRGAAVVEGSVFGSVPGTGCWGTALLLDGNVGIGGRPVALLRRVKDLLCGAGRVLAELMPPGTPPTARRVRLEHNRDAGPWFAWATVAADQVEGLAAAAGFAVSDVWLAGDRWFAQLESVS